MNDLVLVCGPAGTGKTTLGRMLSKRTGWPTLDKDTLTGPLASSIAASLTGDPHDRQSEPYLQHIRPLEYRILGNLMRDIARNGGSAIITAPFVAELNTPQWLDQQRTVIGHLGARLTVILLRTDAEANRTRLTSRAAPRDQWKLQNWPEYAASMERPIDTSGVDAIIENSGDRTVLQEYADALTAELFAGRPALV